MPSPCEPEGSQGLGVVDGRYVLSYEPEPIVPISDWLALQKRFAHLLRPENAQVVADIQEAVETEWDSLVARCGTGATAVAPGDR
jgi:pyruvate ferredoxin oxidoreductase beta subunit